MLINPSVFMLDIYYCKFIYKCKFKIIYVKTHSFNNF